MAERFVAELHPTKNLSRYPNEADMICGIVQLQGLDPTQCLFRGYSGADRVKNAATRGDDHSQERRSLYAMEATRKPFRRDSFEFIKDKRLKTVTTPTFYASLGDPAAVSVFRRENFTPDKDVPYLWHLKEGSSLKEALEGIIVFAEPASLESFWGRLDFGLLLESVRRNINR